MGWSERRIDEPFLGLRVIIVLIEPTPVGSFNPPIGRAARGVAHDEHPSAAVIHPFAEAVIGFDVVRARPATSSLVAFGHLLGLSAEAPVCLMGASNAGPVGLGASRIRVALSSDPPIIWMTSTPGTASASRASRESTAAGKRSGTLSCVQSVSRSGGGDVTATVDVIGVVERSGELKADLVEFSQKPQYEKAFHEVAAEHLGENCAIGEGKLIDILDRFVLLPPRVPRRSVSEYPGQCRQERVGHLLRDQSRIAHPPARRPDARTLDSTGESRSPFRHGSVPVRQREQVCRHSQS
jgi:hypothetical protein